MTLSTWEVELKFHVDDTDQLEKRLLKTGFSMIELQQHEDVYLRHPCRDFAATDEAFRIRRVNESARLTYKGPRSTGPVKTREELELAIDHSAMESWKLLMDKLGFQQVVPVRKARRVFENRSAAEFNGMHVTMDSVEGLGDFAEIEMVVSEATAVEAAEQRVTLLAARLGLERRQPRSYLSLLLASLGQ
jgi:adenylate cyclase, class 2